MAEINKQLEVLLASDMLVLAADPRRNDGIAVHNIRVCVDCSIAVVGPDFGALMHSFLPVRGSQYKVEAISQREENQGVLKVQLSPKKGGGFLGYELHSTAATMSGSIMYDLVPIAEYMGRLEELGIDPDRRFKDSYHIQD